MGRDNLVSEVCDCEYELNALKMVRLRRLDKACEIDVDIAGGELT